MKWDFFYDENEGEPYKSIHDWYKDINHLILPVILLVMLVIAFLVLKNYFHS